MASVSQKWLDMRRYIYKYENMNMQSEKQY